MTGCRILLSAFLTALIWGCTETGSSRDGMYIYSVDMSDTTAFYDIWVTVRTPVHTSADSLKMIICITSPDRHRYSVDTWVVPIGRQGSAFDRDDRLGSRFSAFSHDIKALYRSGVRPSQSGEWVLSFTADPSRVDGIWVSAEKKGDN